MMEPSVDCIPTMRNSPLKQVMTCDYVVQCIVKRMNVSKRKGDMVGLFLWDGKNYGDSFVTSRKVNGSALESIDEGSVFRITSYSVLSVNPPLVFLRDLKFETNVTFVLNTPLSLQTIPRPITMIGFDAYLSSFIRPSIIPDPPKKPSKKRSSPSLSTSSIENSLSLSYEDKRLQIPVSPPLSNDPSTMHPIDFALRYVFGYPSFRDDQRDIVTAAVSQRDVFVLKSTGGGKSLCFQIPAVIDRGLTVVFSPLLSLLQDQIEALLKRPCGGVPCGFLSSDCSPGMRRKTMEELERGGRHGGSLEMKLLYTTPEYFEYSEQLLRHLESLDKEVGSA
ncbi:hypothetical protein WA538_001330 [Blastocystis sp. DL]